jgi:hypothetical protein
MTFLVSTLRMRPSPLVRTKMLPEESIASDIRAVRAAFSAGPLSPLKPAEASPMTVLIFAFGGDLADHLIGGVGDVEIVGAVDSDIGGAY